MSDQGAAFVRRARALIGVAFRFQGRDRDIGLDCVGLAAHAYAIPMSELRHDYSPRGSRGEAERWLAERFQSIQRSELQPGDLMLCAVRADRVHLAIHCGDSFVHADARLRRVVEVPGAPAWPVIGAFRPPSLLSS